MTYVTTVSYLLLVNGQLGSMIKSIRGLCQEDLIFPYLYLICAKGLSTLPDKAENSFKIISVKVARSSPTINHLLFVNDNIIFRRAKTSRLGSGRNSKRC